MHRSKKHPAPLLPTKTYTTLVPTKKGVIFQRVARIREIKERRWFFRHKSAKFWKRVNILHTSAYFHLGFHTLAIGRVFKCSFHVRHNEKYDVRRKIYLIQFNSLSQKGYFILYNENKIVFCFKEGYFIGPQNQRLRLKKGCFFAQDPRKGGIFQAWVRAWYTFWSGVAVPSKPTPFPWAG